jgi:hypothetical protein
MPEIIGGCLYVDVMLLASDDSKVCINLTLQGLRPVTGSGDSNFRWYRAAVGAHRAA